MDALAVEYLVWAPLQDRYVSLSIRLIARGGMVGFALKVD